MILGKLLVTGIVAGLMVASMPQVALTQEIANENQPLPSGSVSPSSEKSPDVRELQIVEQTLRKALEKSEADKADLEKKLTDSAAREQQVRDESAKLAVEKDAIEKSCPKPAPATVKAATKQKKKKTVHKWWTSERRASDNLTAGDGSAQKTARLKKTGKKKKKVGKTKKKAASTKKACTGPVISLADIRKALSGKRNLAGKNLSGLNLTGMALVGADLKGACLAKTNLERADLAEANLERADLSGANLRMASLRLANINAAKLDGAKLDNAIWIDSRICLDGSVGGCKDVIP
jgi:hypothetical protein